MIVKSRSVSASGLPAPAAGFPKGVERFARMECWRWLGLTQPRPSGLTPSRAAPRTSFLTGRPTGALEVGFQSPC